ncbi:hypothetical protein DY023_07515 [Microbacterium bovistercoris]|uniref:DUF7878 domain-containing protein n=1 Tax=Microbacterium bovistercoris TaxID=2293570 RepID=A0A371NUK9_9MICO|nr:hypothetical protein [Microbacterium bovistercoris]REJ06128.1 hypothetical protein DY023_07515 [Microbacterium bovistercoris]
MELTYDGLRTDELQGTTQADYLIAFDAHLCLVESATTIFDEPGFPVVELARSLLLWLRDPARGDFEFDSMSYEERGVISIWKVAAGWAVGSVLAPGARTTPADWRVVDECCRRFIARVEADLGTLGLDPVEVLRR